MSKSYRFKTNIGVDKEVRLNIEQDFDFLEILSLKLRQDDLYTRFCADYGVVAGRVFANGGLGIPNVSISIFVPISEIDENDPIISTLYPYKSPYDKNEDNYRYNLLPYTQEYGGHTPTGTFPTREDVLTRKEVLEVYEKYYKYTVRTNDSGDFMIVGVPLGQQKLVMDLDLSNIGPFSLRPSDLIRMGMGVPNDFNGQLFKSSEDLNSLPQILNNVVDIEVTPFWGQNDLCDVGITRFDFDLREMGVDITPHSVFMGSIFSSDDEDYLKSKCKPKKETGKLCNLTSGPGQILCIRQTNLVDSNGDPILEEYKLEDGGNIIDENGVWLTELPMNLDYVVTNEFGEQILSNDPTVGVPTSGKYRFRIKWQNQGTVDDNEIYRADYLVPNIKEHGWNQGSATIPTDEIRNKSYAFSLDWEDYYDKTSAINCEDTFYKFKYNKVYTISSHIDYFRWGRNRQRFLGIKDIEDSTCVTEVNKYPVNEGFKNNNFLIFIFNYIITILTPAVLVIIIILHIAAFIYNIVLSIINIIQGIIDAIAQFLPFLSFTIISNPSGNPFLNFPLPMMVYPDCEFCNCNFRRGNTDTVNSQNLALLASYFGAGALAEPTLGSSWLNLPSEFPECDTPQDRFETQIRLVLSGYDNGTTNNKYENLLSGSGNDSNDYVAWYKSPVYPIFQNDGDIKNWRISNGPTWAQRLNQMNSRANFWGATTTNGTHYSNVTTAIQTQLINDQFGPGAPVSDPLLDNVFVVILDAETNLSAGEVISFNNPEDTLKLRDDNIGKIVTGDTTSSYNPNGYVTKTVRGLSRDTNNANYVTDKNIHIYNPEPQTEYKYYSGIEYFQVITGITYNGHLLMNQPPDASGSAQPTSGQLTNLLNYYIFSPHQSYGCDDNSAEDLPDFSTGGLANKYGGNNFIIYFMVRGVDLHTPRQKIRYDLSKVFGYNEGGLDDFPGVITVQGEYHLNIPIQSNTPYNDDMNPNDDGWSDNDDNYQILSKWRDDTGDTNGVFNGQRIPSPHYIRRWKWGGGDDYSFIDSFGFGCVQFIDFEGQGTYSQMDTPNLYHPSFTFKPENLDGGFETVKSRIPAYYVALDGSFGSQNGQGYTKLNEYESYMGRGTGNNNETTGNYFANTSVQQGIISQGVVAGVGYQYTKEGSNRKASGKKSVFSMSPTYLTKDMTLWTDFSTNESVQPAIPVTRLDNYELVFRSDRIPIGDIVDFPDPDELNIDGGDDITFRRYGLHMNAAMTIYRIEDGTATIIGYDLPELNPFNESFNQEDEEEDLSGTTLGNVISSFTCNEMVPFYAYDGVCDTFNFNENEIEPLTLSNPIRAYERVENGCYIFLIKRPIYTLGADIRMFTEYRTRLRFNYALCQGIISQSFFNNWVSGSLFLPSFQNKRVYALDGDVKKYKYCGSPDFYSDDLKYQGPIYRNTETNSFYYRSTPHGNSGFIGQSPTRDYNGKNGLNIWYPTTITELGPKDEFSYEISLTPDFQGFVIDKIKNTSYNDTSNIVNLFAISRLTNAGILEQYFNLGDASVDKLFSRENKFVDADFAQLTSINSEFGVVPFLDGNYEDEKITFCEYQTGNQTGKPLIGVWFDSDVISRRKLGEGVNTYGEDVNGLTSNYGYANSQDVPYYKWRIEETGSQVFGTELNNWNTLQIFNNKHQGTEFFDETTNTYMYPDNLYGLGYLYNREANGDPKLDIPNNPYANGSYKVGSPFHFYFGLNVGKTAINKYIRKYILT